MLVAALIAATAVLERRAGISVIPVSSEGAE
jgi:hypothetical protein